MENRDVLLKEYETCQQSINNTNSRYWITVGIFISMNTALWAAVVYKAANTNFACNVNWEWIILPVLVTLLGAVMIFIINCLSRWLERVNWLMNIKYSRMIEIEKDLGMRANTYIDALDNWDKLSKKQRALGRLVELYRNKLPPARERDSLKNIYKWLITIWVLLMLMSWLFSFLIFITNSTSWKY